MVDFYSERTVAWIDGKVRLIDQTKLPQRFTYVDCKDHLQVADAIRKMVVRGAPAIGVAAAMGLALAAQNSKASSRDRLLAQLEAAADVLRRTRPTAVNLFWALRRILDEASSTEGSANELKKAVLEEARAMAEEDVEANRRMGDYGADLLNDGDVVLTHCNTGTLATVGYGTALGVMRTAREKGKRLYVVTTETRPALQGARLTCYELREDGFPVTLISDTAVAHTMATRKVDKVILGADRVVRTGHAFNKIGTYQIALLAGKHRIPFYVAAPHSSFDVETRWKDVVIEERDFDEVVKVRGRRIAPRGVNVFNPAFDMTPPELITAIITDRGVLRPPYEESIAKMMGKS